MKEELFGTPKRDAESRIDEFLAEEQRLRGLPMPPKPEPSEPVVKANELEEILNDECHTEKSCVAAIRKLIAAAREAETEPGAALDTSAPAVCPNCKHPLHIPLKRAAPPAPEWGRSKSQDKRFKLQGATPPDMGLVGESRIPWSSVEGINHKPPAVLDSEWGGENGPPADSGFDQGVSSMPDMQNASQPSSTTISTDALSEAIRRALAEMAPWYALHTRFKKWVDDWQPIFAKHILPVLRDAVSAAERKHADQMAHASESFLEQLAIEKEAIALLVDKAFTNSWVVQDTLDAIRSLDTATIVKAHEERIRAEGKLDQHRIDCEFCYKEIDGWDYCNVGEALKRAASKESNK